MNERLEALAKVADLMGLENDLKQMEAIYPVFEDIYRHIKVLRTIDLGDIEPGVVFTARTT